VVGRNGEHEDAPSEDVERQDDESYRAEPDPLSSSQDVPLPTGNNGTNCLGR
jgi:hypothetical protein